MTRWMAAMMAAGLVSAACASASRPPPALVQNRDLEAFASAASWPGSEASTAIIAAQQFIAARHEHDGYEYFQRLAREQPGRPVLVSLEGLMQARVAGEVPLLRRVAWVEEAIAKLDRGAEAEPVAGRLLRGLVYADLPERFGKARQAVADLEASLDRRDAFPVDLDRAIFRGLAQAFRTLGEPDRSTEMLRRAGLDSFDAPSVASNVSVGPKEGFRFSHPRLAREAEGVYVAEGFDFGNIAFIVNEAGVVAIDAGTTEESARGAMRALREITSAPVRYVILTHSHWDHVGGLAAVRERDTVVVARANFAQELARMRSAPRTFSWFFGNGRVDLDVRPDRVVKADEVLHHGNLELRLIPVRGGETNDALFVHLPQRKLLFVGDAFMPYIGPPFVSEGSPEGYLDALAKVRSLAPERLVHGHPPLTRLFTVEALPGLELALRGLYDRYAPQALASRPLAEMLHDNFLPETLRETPNAVIPYLIVRDHFLQRLHQENAGYWTDDGEGMEVVTRSEWAGVLDELGGRDDAAFARVASDLIARGDAPLALRVAEMGLLRHPKSEKLLDGRKRALSMLIERSGPVDPFRFIIYSQWAGVPLRPIPGAAKKAQ